jgi:hypothetical protein
MTIINVLGLLIGCMKSYLTTAFVPILNEQVTRHEYEVETSNGRTITKKRKTRSTVLFKACICFSLNEINPIDVHLNYISTPDDLASKCRLLICLRILNFFSLTGSKKTKDKNTKNKYPSNCC